MEKITIENVSEIGKKIGEEKSSFYSNPFYLLEKCYFKELGGDLLVGQSSIKRNGEYNLLTVPRHNLSLENYNNFTLLYEEETKQLERMGFRITNKEEVGPEFFYKTDDFIKMEGGNYSLFRKKVHHFENEFQTQFKVFMEYDNTKVTEFINNWRINKKLKLGSTESEGMEREAQENIQILKLLETVPNKSFFVEINGTLAGFQITTTINKKLWAAIYQKVNYSFKGLTEFLYYISAKGNQDIDFFSTGSGGKNQGIINYKRSLNPWKEKMLYFVSGELYEKY